MLTQVESALTLKSIAVSPVDELYLLDATSFELIYLNAKAEETAQLNGATARQNIELLLGITEEQLQAYVETQKACKTLFESQSKAPSYLRSDNGSQLRVMLVQSDAKEYILVTRTETSVSEHVIMALNETEERFEAIVSNIPGMVFQCMMDESGELSFTYVSDACHAVLGITPEELMEDGYEFLAIMNERDRKDLRAKLYESVETLEKLDWEGRVWIDGWQDTKWLNMRASTKKLPNGHTVWDGILFNITASKKEKEAMEQSRRDLEKLNAHMSHIKEQERMSIAREIHDDLGGNLTAMQMSLSTLALQAGTENAVSAEQLQDLEALVNRTFEAVHRISGNLRPSVLDLGIVDALDWQVNQFKKQVDIHAKFITNQSAISLSTEQAMALFRVCQEALALVCCMAN